MTKIIIADDHAMIREAEKEVLHDFDIVGEATDGESALSLVKKTQPDVIILDLSMPKRSGMSVITEIKKAHSETKILVATISNSPMDARQAFELGADGYFLKDEGAAALRTAMTKVLEGVRYVSPGIAKE